MKQIAILVGLAATTALAGCSDFRQAVGTEKSSPDEFAVVARAPLSLPPNFALRPPDPGAPRPQERTVKEGAKALVLNSGSNAPSSSVPSFGFSTNTPSASPSASVTSTSQAEVSFRERLGTSQADPNIREVVNAETRDFVYEDEFLIDRLIFWKDDPNPGVVLDADAERRRLQENAALGKSPTSGATPSIQRKRGNLLERIF